MHVHMLELNQTAEEFRLQQEEDLLIPPAAYVAAAVALFLIGFFGFFLNLLVMVLMFQNHQLWTPLNIILFNLVMSDFLVSILGNPWTFFSAVFYTWIFGKAMCVVYGFIMSLLGITSITTLTVLAFERYLMIARPFRSASLNCSYSIHLVAGIWIYSLALTTPPLVGWGEYVNEAANISCSVNWEEKSFNSMTYILYLFAFGLFFPLLVISFSYINIMVKLKRNTFKMGRVAKSEGKIAYMVLVMIIAFLLAWTPYAVLALIIQFGDPSIVTPGIAVIPAILAKSSICYNPIIYVGLNTQFKKSWMNWIGRGRKSRSLSVETVCVGTSKHTPPAEENNIMMKVITSKFSEKNKEVNVCVVQNDNEEEDTFITSI